MKFYKLILILSASFNLIVQTSYASSQSMKYPLPNGFMHLFLNDLVYYVTSSNNVINLATLDSKATGSKTGADLLESAKRCGIARHEPEISTSATITDVYGNKTYTTVTAEDLTFNNKLISAKDLAQNLSTPNCSSSKVETKPCNPSENQCQGAGATYENSNCKIETSEQCTTIGGLWDNSSNICNCKSQSSATGENFQKNKFINNNFNNKIWSNNVCLAIDSESSCKNSPSDADGTVYGKLSWDGAESICKGPETACQLSLLGYLPLDTLVRNLPKQVEKTGDTKKAYKQFMESLAQNPVVMRFIYSLISDINWISEWSNSLLKSSIGESLSSQGGSAEAHNSAQKNARTILPYLINPSKGKFENGTFTIDPQTLAVTYSKLEIPLFSTPTSNENYNSIINPYYLNNNPNSVLPENFKFTNLKYPVNYVTITKDGNSLPVPINNESFNYCKYASQLNQSNCIMLSQIGMSFGISQPNSGLKPLLLANLSEANPKHPLWTDAYCSYQQSNNPAIYDTDRCQTTMQQVQSYWGMITGVLFAYPALKGLAQSAYAKFFDKGIAAKEKRKINDSLAKNADDIKRKKAEIEKNSKAKQKAKTKADALIKIEKSGVGLNPEQVTKAQKYANTLSKDMGDVRKLAKKQLKELEEIGTGKRKRLEDIDTDLGTGKYKQFNVDGTPKTSRIDKLKKSMSGFSFKPGKSVGRSLAQSL